jgi:hypothetical protein
MRLKSKKSSSDDEIVRSVGTLGRDYAVITVGDLRRAKAALSAARTDRDGVSIEAIALTQGLKQFPTLGEDDPSAAKREAFIQGFIAALQSAPAPLEGPSEMSEPDDGFHFDETDDVCPNRAVDAQFIVWRDRAEAAETALRRIVSLDEKNVTKYAQPIARDALARSAAENE